MLDNLLCFLKILNCLKRNDSWKIMENRSRSHGKLKSMSDHALRFASLRRRFALLCASRDLRVAADSAEAPRRGTAGASFAGTGRPTGRGQQVLGERRIDVGNAAPLSAAGPQAPSRCRRCRRGPRGGGAVWRVPKASSR